MMIIRKYFEGSWLSASDPSFPGFYHFESYRGNFRLVRHANTAHKTGFNFGGRDRWLDVTIPVLLPHFNRIPLFHLRPLPYFLSFFYLLCLSLFFCSCFCFFILLQTKSVIEREVSRSEGRFHLVHRYLRRLSMIRTGVC